MVPRRGTQLPNLEEKSVFIAAGTNDPICSPAESEELKTLLESANANVTMHWENRGHQLTMGEVEKQKSGMRKRFYKYKNKKHLLIISRCFFYF